MRSAAPRTRKASGSRLSFAQRQESRREARGGAALASYERRPAGRGRSATGVERLNHTGLVVVILLVSAAWLAAQRAATASAKLSRYAVGIWTPALVGAINGAAATAVISVIAPNLGLRLPQIALMFVGVFTLSCLSEQLVAKRSRPRLLLVGAPEQARELLRDLKGNPRLRCEWIGAVTDGVQSSTSRAMQVVGRVGDLSQIVRDTRPDLVVVADVEQRDRAIDELLSVASLGFRVVGVPGDLRVRAGTRSDQAASSRVVHELAAHLPAARSRALGRALDVTLAVVVRRRRRCSRSSPSSYAVRGPVRFSSVRSASAKEAGVSRWSSSGRW